MCHIYFVFMSRTKPCQVPNSTDNDLVKLNVHFKSTNRLDACCLYIAIFRSRIRFVEININQILSQACAKLFFVVIIIQCSLDMVSIYLHILSLVLGFLIHGNRCDELPCTEECFIIHFVIYFYIIHFCYISYTDFCLLHIWIVWFK